MRIMKIAREKFVIFYFQSRFYLVSPWNLLLTRETNGFLCHAKMKREKEKVETLFLTKQSSPLLFSNNKFQRGGKEEIVDVQINRDWDLKSLENSILHTTHLSLERSFFIKEKSTPRRVLAYSLSHLI